MKIRKNKTEKAGAKRPRSPWGGILYFRHGDGKCVTYNRFYSLFKLVEDKKNTILGQSLYR